MVQLDQCRPKAQIILPVVRFMCSTHAMLRLCFLKFTCIIATSAPRIIVVPKSACVRDSRLVCVCVCVWPVCSRKRLASLRVFLHADSTSLAHGTEGAKHLSAASSAQDILLSKRSWPLFVRGLGPSREAAAEAAAPRRCVGRPFVAECCIFGKWTFWNGI